MKILFLLYGLAILGRCLLEFELIRNPHKLKKLNLTKSECQDPKTVSGEAPYLQLCYDKDIAYTLEFDLADMKYLLAIDTTTPISWLKEQGPSKCNLLDGQGSKSGSECTLLHKAFFTKHLSQLPAKIKGKLKQEVTKLVQKMKIKIDKGSDDDQGDKAVIEGSNQVVYGYVKKVENISFVAKNSDRLSKTIDLLLLSLYILGEKDVLTLNSTTFMAAHKITPNLNSLCDGAISLRFDESSENSFLKEMFKQAGTDKKIVSVYLGQDKQIVTIGGYWTAYTEKGIASFRRIKMEEDQKYGKLAKTQGLVLEGQDYEDSDLQMESFAVFTLSASYLGLPRTLLSQFIEKFLTKACRINSQDYLECSTKSDKYDQFIESTLNIDFDSSVLGIEVEKLKAEIHGKNAIFNIKAISSNITVMGQPFFLENYIYFDFDKDEIAFAPRELTLEEQLVATATIAHCIMVTVLLAVCCGLTSNPFQRMASAVAGTVYRRGKAALLKTVGSYRPINDIGEQGRNQNPSERHKVEDEDI